MRYPRVRFQPSEADGDAGGGATSGVDDEAKNIRMRHQSLEEVPPTTRPIVLHHTAPSKTAKTKHMPQQYVKSTQLGNRF